MRSTSDTDSNSEAQDRMLDTCAICLEEVDECDRVTGKCKHSFHNCCIRQWIEKQNTCPMCRQKWSKKWWPRKRRLLLARLLASAGVIVVAVAVGVFVGPIPGMVVGSMVLITFPWWKRSW